MLCKIQRPHKHKGIYLCVWKRVEKCLSNSCSGLIVYIRVGQLLGENKLGGLLQKKSTSQEFNMAELHQLFGCPGGPLASCGSIIPRSSESSIGCLHLLADEKEERGLCGKIVMGQAHSSFSPAFHSFQWSELSPMVAPNHKGCWEMWSSWIPRWKRKWIWPTGI